MATILLLGTCDTKLPELLFVKHQILTTATTQEVLLLDLGRTPTAHPEITISQHDILQHASTNNNNNNSNNNKGIEVSTLPRQQYITTLLHHATTAVTHLHKARSLHAVLGIGGSCGTALATGIMRNVFPVGFPKLMVSTMASGDVKPYVEETDITMMYSVVDVAGTNRILRRILGNAAAAVGGMVSRAWIVVNELGFKLLCSYQQENQAWREKRRSRENRQYSLFISSLLNLYK